MRILFYVSLGLVFHCANPPLALSVPSLDGIAVETLNNDRQVQKMNDKWTEEESRLLDEVERLRSGNEVLQQQLDKLGRMLDAEKTSIAMQKRRLVETEKLRDGLQLWLQGIFSRLSASRDNGLPFLRRERDQRFASLESVLNDPYAPSHERFRRVFEALLVEAEYGHSGEVYRSEVDINGEMTQVDLLRIGRLALFYRTLDRQQGGIFDPGKGRFVVLPDDSLMQISNAFKVVRRETATEMVTLPIGRVDLP